jgi:hypothetical protein
VENLKSRLLPSCLAAAMVLACVWPQVSLTGVGNGHLPGAVVHDGQQPLHCRCLRPVELVRLCVTLKSVSALYLIDSDQVLLGKRLTASVVQTASVGPASTLQSQSARLQV